MLYKRSSAIVAYWHSDRGIIHNYATGRVSCLTSPAVDILGALDRWCTREEIERACTAIEAGRLTALLEELLEAGAIETSKQPERSAERALRGWGRWAPSAAFFHMATKDVAFGEREEITAALDKSLVLDPPPPWPPATSDISLPGFETDGDFPRVLMERRSWRRFGTRAITPQELSSLLGLTWGTQQWVHPRPGLRFPLKTAPSGGACHSLGVRLVVNNVEHLSKGVYQYNADAHGLDRVGAPWSSDQITAHLGKQRWAADAAVLFFMTADFSRVQWKYKYPRAYRAVLLEAGHFCQTFCLVATWLRLAPFCTAAFADSCIEQSFGIDGINESVIYAAGVAARPDGIDWAPNPENGEPLPTSAPAHSSSRKWSWQSKRGDDE